MPIFARRKLAKSLPADAAGLNTLSYLVRPRAEGPADGEGEVRKGGGSGDEIGQSWVGAVNKNRMVCTGKSGTVLLGIFTFKWASETWHGGGQAKKMFAFCKCSFAIINIFKVSASSSVRVSVP